MNLIQNLFLKLFLLTKEITILTGVIRVKGLQTHSVQYAARNMELFGEMSFLQIRILNEFEANDPRYKFTFYEVGDNILTGVPTGPLNTDPDAMNMATSTNGVSLKREFFENIIFRNG